MQAGTVTIFWGVFESVPFGRTEPTIVGGGRVLKLIRIFFGFSYQIYPHYANRLRQKIMSFSVTATRFGNDGCW